MKQIVYNNSITGEIMPSIYQLNFSNDHYYIGQTSRPIEQRIRQHKITRGAGCPKLYQAWRVEEFLGYEVLEEPPLELLDAREQYWISQKKPSLNTLPGGKALRGFNHPRAKYTAEQIQEVVRLWLETTLTKQEISDATGVSYGTIQDILKLRQHLWVWDTLDPKQLEAAAHLRDKTTTIWGPDNEPVTFSCSIREQERILNLTPGTLHRVLRGQVSQGYSAQPHPTVKLRDPLGTPHEFTLPEAKLQLPQLDDFTTFQLQQLLKGKNSAGWSSEIITWNNES